MGSEIVFKTELLLGRCHVGSEIVFRTELLLGRCHGFTYISWRSEAMTTDTLLFLHLWFMLYGGLVGTHSKCVAFEIIGKM